MEFNHLTKLLGNEKILSCLISKKNELVFEYYKNKKVEKNLQTLNSCTKSVMSSLIGIAIDKGHIKDIHIPIKELFANDITNSDLRLNNLTIYHLLTMTSGFDWPEFGEWNYFAPMLFSNNIIKFIFERPIIENPGEKMNYHSGCSHLLSAILQKYTNKSAHEYAKEYLFKPLGITESLWHERHKVSLGADGLRLKAIDLLKFGNLYLNQGVFNGKRIISSSWIQESTTPRFMTYPDIGHYAYHWWTSKVVVDENEIHFYFALGFGGQFIIIVPSLDVVVVFTSRIYDHSLRPMFYFKEYILTTFYE